MNKNIIIILIIILGIVALIFGLMFLSNKTTTVSDSVEYRNTTYGFSFSLPESWRGYTIVEGEWKGDSMDVKGNALLGAEKGPLISIRHPLWTAASPRQDVLVMVFTLQEWSDMQEDKFHIGAAPINPSELGRNSKYVFGLPARYNFAYQSGFEEVDQLIRANSLKAF